MIMIGLRSKNKFLVDLVSVPYNPGYIKCGSQREKKGKKQLQH